MTIFSKKELADCLEHAELRGRSLKDIFTDVERRMLVAALTTPGLDPATVENLPKPETMLAYASILEKPQYQIDAITGIKYRLATGEPIEAACAALRYCAALSPPASSVTRADRPGEAS